VWEFRHQDDEEVLSSWAKHFRNHYCQDSDIEFLRGRKSRTDYLNDSTFPCKTTKLGPGIRAGDFGEILVADYLQWIVGYWVPRIRWGSKIIRDESPKGCDVIGLRFYNSKKTSKQDILAIFEAKTRFSRGPSKYRLQDAVNDSAKDHIRIDESLNYIKRKLYAQGDNDGALKIDRFQSPVDIPYKEIYGAAALFDSSLFDYSTILKTDTTKIPRSKKSDDAYPHPNRDNLVLIVILGNNMMNLVHELYRRAADEA